MQKKPKTKQNKSVAFKNNVPFINCISKISGVQIDNAEDLEMSMYNLLEYSKNCKKATGNYESFKYKTSITGNTSDGDDANKVGKNETKLVVPLKHLSNFWRTLNIPMINCEVELILIWSKNCVLAE